jgi:hypothetical protein
MRKEKENQKGNEREKKIEEMNKKLGQPHFQTFFYQNISY